MSLKQILRKLLKVILGDFENGTLFLELIFKGIQPEIKKQQPEI